MTKNKTKEIKSTPVRIIRPGGNSTRRKPKPIKG